VDVSPLLVAIRISVWIEVINQIFCQIGKLATGIFISFIAVYGDEVLQNLLFASIKTI